LAWRYFVHLVCRRDLEVEKTEINIYKNIFVLAGSLATNKNE